MLIIKDWKGLIAAGISPEQDMVIKHFYYFGPVSSNLCKRIRDEDWRAALRGAAAQAARCRGCGAAGGKNEMLDRGEGLGEHTVDFVGKKEQLGSPMPSQDRWSRLLFTRFGNRV